MSDHTSQNTTRLDESEDWELITFPGAPDVITESSSGPSWRFKLTTGFLRLSLEAHLTTIERVELPDSQSEEAKIMHQQDQSPLFRLPAEIRLHIYELLYQIPTTGRGVQLRRLNTCRHHYQISTLTSLLTCRRFLDEAEDLFYLLNRLSVDDGRFWTSLGNRRRNAIIMFAVNATSAASLYSVLQPLHQAPNLKSLHIIRQQSARFIDPRSWAVMAPQIIAEIKKMGRLEEVKIFTPKAQKLNENEMARERRLHEIDAKICGAVQRVKSLDKKPQVDGLD